MTIPISIQSEMFDSEVVKIDIVDPDYNDVRIAYQMDGFVSYYESEKEEKCTGFTLFIDLEQQEKLRIVAFSCIVTYCMSYRYSLKVFFFEEGRPYGKVIFCE